MVGIANIALTMSITALIINIVFTIYQIRRIHKYYRMKMYEYEITRKIREIINEIVKEIKNEN